MAHRNHDHNRTLHYLYHPAATESHQGPRALVWTMCDGSMEVCHSGWIQGFHSRYPYESFVPVLTVTYKVYRRWLLYPNYMETFDNLNVIDGFFSRYPLFSDFSWVCHGVSKMRNWTIHPVFAFEVFRGRMWKFGCKVLWGFTCELKTASIGACGIFLYVFSDFPLSGGMKTSSV